MTNVINITSVINGANALKINTNAKFKRFEVKDVEHLIDILNSLRPLSKDTIKWNIAKYGYNEQEDYILEALGYSTNSKNKIKIKKEVNQQAKIFRILFNIDKNCFIRLRNKQTGEIRSYNVQALQDPYRLQAILKSQYFSNINDMMYSLNCYNNMSKCTENTLFSLQNFALDIDFNTDEYTIKQVINIIKKMYKDEQIPVPNILEFGHRIRLIYSIEDVAVKKGSKRAINLINKIAKEINNRLPKKLNSSVQALTTYGRIIGSINTKKNKKIQAQIINPNKYILRELQQSLLQPLKVKTYKKKNSKTINLNNIYTLNLSRLADLEKIQKIRQDGFREILCYLYRNYCILANFSEEETWEKLKKFNANFTNPLSEKFLNTNTKNINRKQYNHKNVTILELLDISEEEEEILKLSTIITDKEKKKRKRIYNKEYYKESLEKAGRTFKQEKLDEVYEKIISLKNKGMKNKDIAIQLELNLKTLERYITKIRKKGLL